eukprot:jgi/Pico_ML_1/50966/g2080.t1
MRRRKRTEEIGRGTRDVVANQGMQDGGETEETQVRNLPSDGNGARHRDVAGNGQEDQDATTFAKTSNGRRSGSKPCPRNACAFDLTAACSASCWPTVTAAQYVRTGACRKVLVVGADALSRCVDWNDRGTCILFGDAAGAVLVTAHEEGTGTTKDADGTTPPRTDPTVGSCALLAFDMREDGGGEPTPDRRYLNPEDGDRTKPDGAERDRPASYANVRMNGQDVFKFAVRAVPATLKASAEKAGIGPEEFADKVDWLVLHQANQRILDAAADRLGFPKERVVSNLAHYGNTSAASIPLALDEAVRQGRYDREDTVAIRVRGGLTWASAIFVGDEDDARTRATTAPGRRPPTGSVDPSPSSFSEGSRNGRASDASDGGVADPRGRSVPDEDEGLSFSREKGEKRGGCQPSHPCPPFRPDEE